MWGSNCSFCSWAMKSAKLTKPVRHRLNRDGCDLPCKCVCVSVGGGGVAGSIHKVNG